MNEYVMANHRFLQLRSADSKALNIASVVEDGKHGALTIQLVDYTPTTRVHVIASHFVPEWSLSSTLSRGSYPRPRQFGFARARNDYTGQTDLGDEHQYILDRKAAKKFVGNTLTKPSLLLNERARGETKFGADARLRDGEVCLISLTTMLPLFGTNCYQQCLYVYVNRDSNQWKSERNVAKWMMIFMVVCQVMPLVYDGLYLRPHLLLI
jgi:hypothetical protein